MSLTKNVYPKTDTREGEISNRLMVMPLPDTVEQGKILSQLVVSKRGANAKTEVEAMHEAKILQEECERYLVERNKPQSDHPLLLSTFFSLISFLTPKPKYFYQQKKIHTPKKVRFQCEETERERKNEAEGEINRKKRPELIRERERKRIEEEKARQLQYLKQQYAELNKKLFDRKDNLPKELRALGFGQNQANENVEYFDQSIRRAAVIWFHEKQLTEAEFKKTINREKFIELIYTYFYSQAYLFDRDYLKDLKETHLGFLFDLYGFMELHKPDQIGLMPFCHALLFVNRENTSEVENEITLAETMDALATEFSFLKNRLKFLSRTSVADEFKKELKVNDFVTLEQGLLTIEAYETRKRRVSFGLCPVLHVRHSEGEILHFPLMYCHPVITEPKRKAGFADLQGNVHNDLSHIDKLIAELKSLKTDDPLFSELIKMNFRKLYPDQVIVPKTQLLSENKLEPKTSSPSTPVKLGIFSNLHNKELDGMNFHENDHTLTTNPNINYNI